MTNKKKYLITSALPYANGPLHIGHLAGAYLSADVYARFLRLKGEDVAFVCGSDEHGAAITIRAKKEGLSPKDIVDKYHHLIKDTFDKLGVTFDIFHRTSDPLHHETAQEFFKKLDEKGDEFIRETNEQYYDEEYNQFLADRYIKGTCPNCDHEEAYGDQCEKCGTALSPLELIDPKSTLSGNTPILKETTHWYFRLDKHEAWLKEWIQEGKFRGEVTHNPNDWKNHVTGQCLSWLDGELKPRAITRDLDWGIPVPLKEGEGKVLYVWFDAPIGYISATKAWAKANGKNWEDYWKGEDAELVHFIGKDNIVFHCIIFPAMLKAYGDVSEPKYVLPINVPANQFVNLENQKISTSRNWAVWGHEYLEDAKDKVTNHIDVLRYVLIKNMPEQKDSEFTWENYRELNDTDLVGKLANFMNRVLVLTHKYYNGVLPTFDPATSMNGRSEGEQTTFKVLTQAIGEKVAALGQAIDRYEFRIALKELIDIASFGNEFLQHNEPWKKQKTTPEEVKAILSAGLQLVTVFSVITQPFIPNTSAKLRTILNLPAVKDGDYNILLENLKAGEALLPAGHQLEKASHLFTKIDQEFIQFQMDKLEENNETLSDLTPLKEEATFDDFMKMDIRTATILEAEKVEKTDKLLKLKVDVGFEERTVVSGIAQHFSAEEVIGKKVLLLANLAPRKIRGVLSKGMILMAEGEEGKLVFVSPPEGFGNGHTVS